MIRLSPGILVSSHQLLKKMYKYENFDVLAQFTRNSSIDGTKTLDVVDTILACEWIEVIGKTAKLSLRGIQIAQNFNTAVKQLMIGDYIRHSKDSWIPLVPRGRKECSPYLPPDVLACIKNAGLLITPATDNIVLWWDQQAQFIRKEQELAILEIGRVGEKLTLEYERRRTGKDPVWKSIESNLAGYDILSILEKGSTARLPIEVKTSKKPIKTANAYITRHEWEVAIESENHKFYFWQFDGNHKKLATLDVIDLQPNIPNDEGAGVWQTATIPFFTYADRFQLYSD